MEILLDERHCHLDENNTCKACGRKYPTSRMIAMCPKGFVPEGKRKMVKLHRIRRTKEQWKEIISNHCSQCPHYIREPDERTLDGMVCALKLKGCSACTAWEKFYEFLLAGNGCPDKRFPPTETIREAATSRTWPTSKPAE